MIIRRLTAVVATGAVLAAQVFFAASVTAQGTPGVPGSLNPITAGLWAGANFDLSSLDRQPGTPAPQPQPTPVPPPAPTPPSGRYAALGDSVAAGVGLPPSDTDTRCGRSLNAYGQTVAQKLQLPLQHVACSGATAGDLTTKQRVNGPNIPAQLDTAYASGTPSVITITAGANDVHWTDILKKCYAYTCGTKTDRYLFDAAVSVMSVKYFYALHEIQQRSGATPPKVVLTGYYNPLSAACAGVIPEFTPAELAWIQEAVNKVNNTIRDTAAGYSFASYAPVDFTGHDLCSTDSWIQNQNDPTPFHPNAAGQQAMATAVLAKLQ
jgi:lysophospholipase L1-like esterase